MQNQWMRRIALAGAMAAVMFGVAHAEQDPLKDPDVQKTMRAMANASTWGHPDQFGEFAGLRYYAHHNYKGALKYFKIGALYADKLSQLSIGLMYLNGEGVRKDPVTAYAWLELAAERDYPEFKDTRDRVKASLTPDQLQQGEKIHAELAVKYGDAVAQPRMAKQLRLTQMEITGSHTGFDSGITQLSTTASCGPSVIVGGEVTPQAGCGGPSMFAKSRWDPKTYFASRDAEWKATVSVGAIQSAGTPDAAAKPAAPAPDQTTPPKSDDKH